MTTLKEVIVRKPSQQEIKTASKWPIWTCKPSTFEWEYTQTETCLILEGSVKITSPDSKDVVTFGPGDWVVFPEGLKCVWNVEKAVKKHYNFD